METSLRTSVQVCLDRHHPSVEFQYDGVIKEKMAERRMTEWSWWKWGKNREAVILCRYLSNACIDTIRLNPPSLNKCRVVCRYGGIEFFLFFIYIFFICGDMMDGVFPGVDIVVCLLRKETKRRGDDDKTQCYEEFEETWRLSNIDITQCAWCTIEWREKARGRNPKELMSWELKQQGTCSQCEAHCGRSSRWQ